MIFSYWRVLHSREYDALTLVSAEESYDPIYGSESNMQQARGAGFLGLTWRQSYILQSWRSASRIARVLQNGV